MNFLRDKEKLKNLKKRTLASLVLIPPALGLIYLGGIYYDLLILALAVLMSAEWSRIVNTNIVINIPRHSQLLWNIAGVIYTISPCVCLIYIRDIPNGLEVTLWLISCVWATDIGAYFIGLSVGGPKIARRISPTKTWAGLLGGMLCSAIVGYAFECYHPEYRLNYFYLAPLVTIVAQFGDFLESGFKRYFNLKDSGTLIPGHGGVLDRVDGLVAAAIFVAMVELW